MVCYLTKANFHQEMKMNNLQYVGIFMYIWWLLKCGGCGKLTKPYRHSRTFQVVSQRSLACINNKNSNILTKWPPVATTRPSGTQRHHWSIGVGGYTFGSSIQARAIPPPSWGSALPVTTIESPMGVLIYNSAEKALAFAIYDCIRRIRPNRCVIWRKLTFIKKIKMMNLQYFCILMYICRLLNLFGGVFLWKAYQTLSPCQKFPTGQPAKPGKHYQQELQNFNETAFCSHNCPPGTQRRHWGSCIPGFTFGSLIQAREIPPPSWGYALPMITGSLYRFQWAFPRSALQKRSYIRYLWLYSENTATTVCYLTKANFRQKVKLISLQHYCIFIYIWWLLKFSGFLCGKLTRPCLSPRQNYPTD